MMKSKISAILVIIVMVGMAVVPCVGSGWQVDDALPELMELQTSYTSTYFEDPGIVIDGGNTDGEYNYSMTTEMYYTDGYPDFPNNTMYFNFINDDSYLYVWADITPDNTSSTGAEVDFLYIFFDVDNDGYFNTSEGDVAFWLEQNETLMWIYSYNESQNRDEGGTWGVLNEDVTTNFTVRGVDANATYGDSENAEYDHMQYEFRIPRALLNNTEGYVGVAMMGYGTLPAWYYPEGGGIGDWVEEDELFVDFDEWSWLTFTDEYNVHVQGYFVNETGDPIERDNITVTYYMAYDGDELTAYIFNDTYYEFDANVTECWGLWILWTYEDDGFYQFYKLSWADLHPGILWLNYTVIIEPIDMYRFNGTVTNEDGDPIENADVMIMFAPDDGWHTFTGLFYIWNYTTTNATGFYELWLPVGTFKVFVADDEGDYLLYINEFTLSANTTLNIELESFWDWKDLHKDTFEIDLTDWGNGTVEAVVYEYSFALFMYTIIIDLIGNWDQVVTQAEVEHYFEYYEDVPVNETWDTTGYFEIDGYGGEVNMSIDIDYPTGSWLDLSYVTTSFSGTFVSASEINETSNNHTITFDGGSFFGYTQYNYVRIYTPNGAKMVNGTYEEQVFTEVPHYNDTDEGNLTASIFGTGLTVTIENYSESFQIEVNTTDSGINISTTETIALDDGVNLISFPYDLATTFTGFDIIDQDDVSVFTHRDSTGTYYSLVYYESDDRYFGSDIHPSSNTAYYITTTDDTNITVTTTGVARSWAGLDLIDGVNFIGLSYFEGAMTISDIFNLTGGTQLTYHDDTGAYVTVVLGMDASYATTIGVGEGFWLFVPDARSF